MSWIYQGNNITSIEQIEKILGYKPYGFIYNIVAENGREYIGQKQLYSIRSKTISKRQLQKEGKSGFRRKKNKKTGEWKYYQEIIKESDWKTYYGSNKQLKQDIKNGANITKYIIKFVKEKSMMYYEETKEIFCSNALEEKRFYNDNALGRFYKKNIMNNK